MGVANQNTSGLSFVSSTRTVRTQISFSTDFRIDIMSEIAWAITRNNSAFLLKKRNCPKPFSTDPMNLTNKHSLRYTGLVNKKAVAITPAADNKGFDVTIKGGPRRSLHKVKALIVKQRYRKDLAKAALRRAAIIVRSQKPLPPRKGSKTAAKKSD